MEALLLLGGNIGDVRATLDRAGGAIGERVGPVRVRSREHWTEPWGFHDERPFLNRALIVDTALAPAALMEACLAIERDLGRTRTGAPGHGPRTVDIDLLLIGDRVIASPGLTLPHPRMHQRAFALAPAADIAPEWIHPVLHRSVLNLLNDVLRTV